MLKPLKKIFIAITILGLIGFVLIKIVKVQDIILKQIYPLKYEQYVEKYAQEYNLDKFWIYAIIKAESNFNPNVVSKSNAIGLMQLLETTASETHNTIEESEFFKETLYDPETNIKLGTKYFSFLLNKYEGNTNLALAAYNAGIGNVDEWISLGIIKKDGSDIENIPYKETNNYVRKILRDYKIYIKLY